MLVILNVGCSGSSLSTGATGSLVSLPVCPHSTSALKSRRPSRSAHKGWSGPGRDSCVCRSVHLDWPVSLFVASHHPGYLPGACCPSWYQFVPQPGLLPPWHRRRLAIIIHWASCGAAAVDTLLAQCPKISKDSGCRNSEGVAYLGRVATQGVVLRAQGWTSGEAGSHLGGCWGQMPSLVAFCSGQLRQHGSGVSSLYLE